MSQPMPRRAASPAVAVTSAPRRLIAGAAVVVLGAAPAAAAAAPQEPVRIGVVARDADSPFVRASRLAAGPDTRRAGAPPVELVIETVADAREVAAAVAGLGEGGVVAVVVTPDCELGAAARRAALGKVPCVTFGHRPEAVRDTVAALIDDTFRLDRIAYVCDRSRESRAFGALLEDLPAPLQVVSEIALRTSAKTLQKKLFKDSPEVLLVDGPPDEVLEFVRDSLAEVDLPVVLLPRAWSPAVAAAAPGAFVVLGKAPSTHAGQSPFRTLYEAKYGTGGHGAGEGHDAIALVLRAIDAAGSRECAAVTAALRGVVAEGARGRVPFDAELGAAVPPPAVWRIREGAPAPYLPAVLPRELDTAATEAPREPDVELGDPFGAHRAGDFEFEPGTQYVLCVYATEDEKYATIDEDLAIIGLSTKGADPILDHLVKDELMARIVSITNTKFGRNPDGTAVPGKSLKISFATRRPDTRRRVRLWPARVGGDHTGAGGEAFGTHCRVYSRFIRKSIFDQHKLEPCIGPDDLRYLDGTYVYGTELEGDRRSELIRALINSYAGSMALTLAHEVGHLASLGHIDDDPLGIMNVEEGAGIDHRDGRFSAGSWARLVDKLGLVEVDK